MKYKTKQKELIHSYFIKHKGLCVTALDLKEAYKDEKIGLTTIYRCLQELQKEEIIRKFTNVHTNSAAYEYIENEKYSNAHYHLKCTNCNTIVHLECSNFKNLSTHIATEHHFTINPTKTTIYGLCKNCTIHKGEG